ncbi:toll/interleukin-1 receptor domain-containing protein [Streptomyces sp. NPDC005355]|uniref:toll/interleukin-1 receptor domain-containing protein n=1 Tax=Streptomyces sp. NPDC005355 TaxID=3157038 RepID=UPI0033A0DC5A
MAEIFINYRTGDGEKTAALIKRELSYRFGENSAFRASESIAPGTRYPEELLRSVRRSALFLAVIGPAWTRFAELRRPDDWVRKEILEAYDCGVPVVPVLEGRKTERLSGADLPTELQRLAEVQSVRLDMQNAVADLGRLGDVVADMVPSLKSQERRNRPSPCAGAVSNATGEVNGTAIQSRDITGDVGTVIKGSSGPVHTGKGDIYNNSRHVSGGRHFSGSGMTYFEGDNQGGLHQHFGDGPRREDDDR